VAGKRVCFLTNNSSNSAADYTRKLAGMGLWETGDGIATAGLVAAEFIRKKYPGAGVYLVGTASYRAELEGLGVRLTEEAPDVVLLSYDTELTYGKLRRACLAIAGGAEYICTHPDINCPSEYGPLPDAGSFMELIRAGTGRLPSVVCGKPDTVMADYVQSRFSVEAPRILMAGDRLYTDIRFAARNGFRSLLVFSGETTRETYAQSDICADITADSVKDCIGWF
jgi:HAD superfamily hydrolase (TIGR01450 family)